MEVGSGSAVSTPSTPRAPVGKKELLKWASDISNIPCKKLEDLRDGVVILKIFARVWPLVVDLKRMRWKLNPKTESEVNMNWECIKQAMIKLQLPLEVYDKKAIMAAKFKQCFTFLVMLYFLQNLSENHDFSVDFAHPIDGKLANFLQSTDSVHCLARGGGLNIEDIPTMHSFSDIADDEASEIGNPVTGPQYPAPQVAPLKLDDLQSSQPIELKETPNRTHDIDVNVSPSKNSIHDVGVTSSPSWKMREPDPLLAMERNSISSIETSSSLNVNWDDDFPKFDESNAFSNKISFGMQTVLSSRKIEKMLIRNMKSKREIDDLKRMLEEAYEKLHEQHGGSASTSSQEVSGFGPLTWKNKQNKLKGELLLTKMRYEIESLNRQVQFLKQEKENMAKINEETVAEMKTVHENELQYQKDLFKNQSNAANLSNLNLKLKDQRDFALELKKIQDEIAFEADRIRQGGLHVEDEDAIEDEILRLRQLKVIQSKQIKTLEENSLQLHAVVEKLEENLRMEQARNKQLHERYNLQDLPLLSEINQVIKQGEVEEQSEEQKNAKGLSKNERILLLQLRKTENELRNVLGKYKSETEHLKYELFKYQQKPTSKLLTSTSDPMEMEFDQEQKIERLESEIKKLKKSNAYLRERSIVFDKANSENGYPGLIDEDVIEDAEDSLLKTQQIWIPSHVIGEEPEWNDVINSEILAIVTTLKDKDEAAAEKLSKLFWKLISDQSILQQRIKKAKHLIVGLHQGMVKMQDDVAKLKAESEGVAEQFRTSSKLELEELKALTAKEKSTLQVKLQLTLEVLRETKDELQEAPAYNAKMLEHALQDDERRFFALHAKVKSFKDELRAYKLREHIWTELIECQRKSIEIAEKIAKPQTSEEAVRLSHERSRLDMEAAQLVQQLQALTHEHLKIRSNEEVEDAVEVAVKEATRLLREQLEFQLSKLEDVNRLKEKETERAKHWEQQAKELQQDLEKDRKLRDAIRKELNEVQKQKHDLAKELTKMRTTETQQVAGLQAKLEELNQQLEEMKTNPASFLMIEEAKEKELYNVRKFLKGELYQEDKPTDSSLTTNTSTEYTSRDPYDIDNLSSYSSNANAVWPANIL